MPTSGLSAGTAASSSPVNGQVTAEIVGVCCGQVGARVPAQHRERQPGRAGDVAVGHARRGCAPRSRAARASALASASRMRCSEPTPGLPPQEKTSLRGAARADELVVDQVGGHPDQGEVAPPLPDDLVARGERDEVGEAFQRDGVAVADQPRHRLRQRHDLRHEGKASGRRRTPHPPECKGSPSRAIRRAAVPGWAPWLPENSPPRSPSATAPCTGSATAPCSSPARASGGRRRTRRARSAVLRRAVELGVDFIDTADSYGPYVAEELIREALHPYPTAWSIATKAGLPAHGPGAVGRRWAARSTCGSSARCACAASASSASTSSSCTASTPSVPADEQFGAARRAAGRGQGRRTSGCPRCRSTRSRRRAGARRRRHRAEPLQPRSTAASDDVLRYCDRAGHRLHPVVPDRVRAARRAGRPGGGGGRAARRHRRPGRAGVAAAALAGDAADPRHVERRAPGGEPARGHAPAGPGDGGETRRCPPRSIIRSRERSRGRARLGSGNRPRGRRAPRRPTRRAAHRVRTAGRARAAAAARHGHRRAAAVRRARRRARRAAGVHVRARPRPAHGRARRSRADGLAAAGPAGGQPARGRRPPPRRRLRRRRPRRPHRRPDRRLAAALGRTAARGRAADRVVVEGTCYARRLRADDEVRLPGARITGNLDLAGAVLSSPTGDALDLTGVTVDGSMLAGRHATGPTFTARGRVRLAGARIGGDLVFSGAEIASTTIPDPAEDAPEGSRAPVLPAGIVDPAACLVADRMHVNGNLELDDGLRTTGTLRLPNAVIGGYLRLSGAQLSSERGIALLADGMEVGGDIEGRDTGRGPFSCAGQVRLVDATVRGTASLSGRPPGHAGRLRAARRPVARRRRALPAARAVRGHAADAEPGGRRHAGLHRRHADPAAAAPGRHAAPVARPAGRLDRQGPRVRRGVHRRPGACGRAWPTCTSPSSSSTPRSAPRAAPATRSTSTASRPSTSSSSRPPRPPGPCGWPRRGSGRSPTAEELWAAEGGVTIDGFDYQTIDDTRITDTRQRLHLLEQATGDYAPGPYEQLAAAYRRAGHEDLAERVLMTRQIRRYREAGPAGRVWGALQRWTVGFGYQPWLAVCWLVLAWLLGAIWFVGHVPTPVDDGQHPVFDAWIFAADTLLPIVNLGQDGYWRLEGASQWIATGLDVVGWILATTAAAGAARILKRV